MNNEQVKTLALANGFKLKEQPGGEMDLNPYVYDFAKALMGGWVSVDDRMPEDGETVLVYSNFGEIFTCRKPVIVSKNSRDEHQDLIGVGKIKYEIFTHWQPLPEPPKQ